MEGVEIFFFFRFLIKLRGVSLFVLVKQIFPVAMETNDTKNVLNVFTLPYSVELIVSSNKEITSGK